MDPAPSNASIARLIESQYRSVPIDAAADQAIALLLADRPELPECVVVIAAGKPVGLVTYREVACCRDSSQMSVGALMLPLPIMLRREALPKMAVVLALMQQHRLAYLPVVEGEAEQLVGLVSEATLLAGGQAAWTRLERENAALRRHRDRLESELQRQSETAEAACRSRDEFLATLSHELRTPLNPIIGFTQLLRQGQLDPDGVLKALEIIERNARMLGRIVEDVLDISRIITGKLTLEMRPVPLATVIEAALQTVRLSAIEKQLDLQVDLDRAVILRADAQRLQQVVWNLLSNAVKFTEPRGQIAVRLERCEQEAVLVVTDTGAGIAPELLPFVFDRFRQGGAASRQGGLGLGLALVRQLVELHGGRVAVASAGPGRGATFTVYLPVTTNAPSDSGMPAFGQLNLP